MGEKRERERFLALSSLYWHHLTALSGMSDLRILSSIQSSVVFAYSRNLPATEGIALSFLEYLFGLDRFEMGLMDGVPEYETRTLAVELILFLKHRDVNTKKRDETSSLVHKYTSRSWYDLFGDIRRALPREHLDDLSTVGFDKIKRPTAFKAYGWQVRLIGMLENWLYWSLCSICFCLGLFALYFKLLLVSSKVQAAGSVFGAVWWLLNFLNQVLSVADPRELFEWRLDLFMFGGGNAHISPEEKAMALIYKSLLAERLWKHEVRGTHGLPNWVIMTTWNDMDFQRLVLEENEEYKSLFGHVVRQTMPNYLKEGDYSNCASTIAKCVGKCMPIANVRDAQLKREPSYSLVELQARYK